MPLSDAHVRNAKPAAAAYKKADGGGLYLLVNPTGGRLWRLDYRFLGKRRTLALGAYPDVSLSDARARRETAKGLIADGIDPGEQKRLDKIAAQRMEENTFGSVVADYLDRLKESGAAEQTIVKNRWLLEKLAKPLIPRPIAKITAPEILHLLQHVESSGRLESARRLRSTIGDVFRLAVKTLRAPTDPTYALRGATKAPVVESHPAIVNEARLGWLMRSIDDYDGWPTLRSAMLFTALTACRPGEVRKAEWSEIDLSQRTWIIPEERTKMRKQHYVPLSDQSVVVLTEIQRFSGAYRLVFPSIRSNDRPLSENAMNAGLQRIGVAKEEHVPHGFRSSFSTIMNERREDGEVIELCLAHTGKDKVRSIYNRAARWPERVAMMQRWADLLDEFRAQPIQRKDAFDFSDLLG